MNSLPIWYELMTPDPAAVAPFYRATLGWEIPAEGHPMPNGSEYREIARSGGGFAGGVLLLSEEMATHGARPAWFTYFNVQDVDAAVARAVTLGGAVHMAPMTMDGVGRMAMVADPQGASFYVMDPTPPPDNPDAESDVFDPTRPGHAHWNEVTTSDAAGARAFYTALFGWTADEAMPMGELGEYVFLMAGDTGFGAINPVLASGARPHWGAVFGVADIDTAKEAALSHGGTVSHDIHEVPGGAFVFYGADPAGAKVAFVGPKGA